MPNDSKFITFVLGAGASFEVSMPTGHELKGKIAKSLSFSADTFGRLSGGNDRIRESLYELGQRNTASKSPKNYFEAAKRICAGMPQAPSIDNFIDSHRSNPVIAEVGKLAIASEIILAERKSTLYVDPSNIHKTVNFARVADTWFNAFFQLLTLNAQEDELPSRFEKVRIITFNYDRTLEHFLFHAIQNYYGSSADRAAKILSHLTVLHPYGQAGLLPWQKSGIEVPYGGEMYSSTLVEVAKTLRTFTEGTERESQIQEIRSSIWNAETITFLGFAYHKLNLQLLFDFDTSLPIRYEKKVFGTALGISESNKIAISNELANLGRFDLRQITLSRELNAAQLFTEYSWSLHLPSN